MGLLWKESSLPDNWSQALIHLNYIVNSLKKKSEQYAKYNEGINADLDKVYVAKIPLHLQKGTGWYMQRCCPPKETRQDTKNLQCQSTTKRNKPQ